MTSGERISDEALVRGSGRGWEQWLAALDAWGASERTHAEIARHLQDVRTAQAPRSARFDADGGRTRVLASFTAKGEATSTVSIVKAAWRERLGALARELEA